VDIFLIFALIALGVCLLGIVVCVIADHKAKNNDYEKAVAEFLESVDEYD